MIDRATYCGTRIILRQISPESEPIFDLILALHAHAHEHKDDEWRHYVDVHGASADAVTQFREYAAQFLGNLGNYKSFGDVRFLPRCTQEQVEKMCRGVDADGKTCKGLENEQWQTAVAGMFVDAEHITEEAMLLGFPGKGHVSGYYPDSPDLTQEEIEAVGAFVGSQELLPENTRVRRSEQGYDILIASATTEPPPDNIDSIGQVKSWEVSDGVLKGKKISLVFGDHQKEMTRIAENMAKAKEHAANDTQKKMMGEYVTSFETGSLKAFKESQKLWVSDIGPDVESDVGFIETYRDPAGIRGEWEGFVAMVNKERTLAFKKLVDSAPAMIPKLPWSKDFEKDVFTPPDFTSLEVLSFAASGLPAGINIPNYDDIRQTFGFKNVSLGNVLGAKGPNETVPFIHADDLDVYQTNRDIAFEVQVGIHELLGHGTGKLLQETSKGVFNFDHDNPPISPVTGKPISTYYKPNETWGSIFGPVASSYEECRAECVAMALACDFDILKIFGCGDGTPDLNSEAGDVLYAAYLSMARAGIVALEFWDPKSEKWGQIHMQARYSILKTFLEAGQDFCKLEYSDANQLSDLTVRIDRSKILSVGRPAVEAYLQKLHVYKSTADLESGKRLYEDKTRVEGAFWQKQVRGIVIRKKLPRKVFVMANTILREDGSVQLKEYEANLEGMLQSWAERDV